jgi:hypothetical protein
MNSFDPDFVLRLIFSPNFVHPIFLVFWNFRRLLLYLKDNFAPIFWHWHFWFVVANLTFQFQIVYRLRPCFFFELLGLFFGCCSEFFISLFPCLFFLNTVQLLNSPLAPHRHRNSFKIGVLIPIDRTQYCIRENREESPRMHNKIADTWGSGILPNSQRMQLFKTD